MEENKRVLSTLILNMKSSVGVFPLLLLVVACVFAERPQWCPEPWPLSQCLGTSATPASPRARGHEESCAPSSASAGVEWQEGMTKHTHYHIDPSKTAVLVIDPQRVYSECPQELTVEALIAPPDSEDFDGHSPMCCERFKIAVDHINKITDAARSKGIPIIQISHVYRDFNGDGSVDNCGRLCDFDVLGWSGWPMAWNLWNAAFPWSEPVYETLNQHGVRVYKDHGLSAISFKEIYKN